MSKGGGVTRVVLAPDKFKGSLTAVAVAEALAAGMLDVLPGLQTIMLPVADGGDGTVAAALSAGFNEVSVDALGPTGEQVRAPYALYGDRAVVELAAVAGLGMLPDLRLDPLGSSTYGLGLVIADAVRRGATQIVLGLGGSASTDGGAGMVQALGARLLDAQGHDLPPGGGNLVQLERLDLAPLRNMIGTVTTIVASDVENPLLGPNGAAAVFGPQKGRHPAAGEGAGAGTSALVSVGRGSDRTRGCGTRGSWRRGRYRIRGVGSARRRDQAGDRADLGIDRFRAQDRRR